MTRILGFQTPGHVDGDWAALVLRTFRNKLMAHVVMFYFSVVPRVVGAFVFCLSWVAIPRDV